MMHKRIQAVLCAMILLCGALLISGTGGASEAAVTEGTDVTAAGWHIAVEDMQLNESLENIKVTLGYTAVETTEYSKQAPEGMTFCMVKLLIEKKGSKETIDWEKMLLTDGEGNEYQRTGDEFLIDLGMKRMPGTKLNFGSNEGWIAYLVPADTAGLVISYRFTDETWRCSLEDISAEEQTTAQ